MHTHGRFRRWQLARWRSRMREEMAGQTVADFDVGDHVRIWDADALAGVGDERMFYGGVVAIEDDSLVVRRYEIVRRAHPTTVELL